MLCVYEEKKKSSRGDRKTLPEGRNNEYAMDGNRGRQSQCLQTDRPISLGVSQSKQYNHNINNIGYCVSHTQIYIYIYTKTVHEAVRRLRAAAITMIAATNK